MAEGLKQSLSCCLCSRFLLADSGGPCIQGLEDNNNGVFVGFNTVPKSNSKPIDARHYLLREFVEI